MTDVFFSYSSRDRDRVRLAHDALTKQGFNVFWDLQIPAGTDWDRWIKSKLDASRCVVVFWTANSAGSDNVRHEVKLARVQGKLVQVMLEAVSDSAMPMGMIAEQAAQLTAWAGDTAEPEWLKLLAAIEDKATPPWIHDKIARLDIQLAAERKRVAEADVKIRALESAHTQEIAAQGDLRRKRDQLAEDLAAERERERGTTAESARNHLLTAPEAAQKEEKRLSKLEIIVGFFTLLILLATSLATYVPRTMGILTYYYGYDGLSGAFQNFDFEPKHTIPMLIFLIILSAMLEGKNRTITAIILAAFFLLPSMLSIYALQGPQDGNFKSSYLIPVISMLLQTFLVVFYCREAIKDFRKVA